MVVEHGCSLVDEGMAVEGVSVSRIGRVHSKRWLFEVLM
jgi:hypothetical protein